MPSLGLTQAKLARDQLAQALQSAQPKSAGETERAGKINNWTLGLAAGRRKALSFASLPRLRCNLNDGDEMRAFYLLLRQALRKM